MSVMYTFSCLFVDHIVNCDYVVNNNGNNWMINWVLLNVQKSVCRLYSGLEKMSIMHEWGKGWINRVNTFLCTEKNMECLVETEKLVLCSGYNASTLSRLLLKTYRERDTPSMLLTLSTMLGFYLGTFTSTQNNGTTTNS